MTDIELIPARIIHPNFYFFREIAVHIVEGCGIEDEEERYTLEEAIIQFLKGGVMTEATNWRSPLISGRTRRYGKIYGTTI